MVLYFAVLMRIGVNIFKFSLIDADHKISWNSILCKIPKFDHITKTLLDLHSLPIHQSILKSLSKLIRHIIKLHHNIYVT